MGGLLWLWCVKVTSKWGSLAGWSSSPPHSHFVNVFISRKDANRQTGKKTQRGEGREGTQAGGRAPGRQRGGGGIQTESLLTLVVLTVCLHRLLTDGG